MGFGLRAPDQLKEYLTLLIQRWPDRKSSRNAEV